MYKKFAVLMSACCLLMAGTHAEDSPTVAVQSLPLSSDAHSDSVGQEHRLSFERSSAVRRIQKIWRGHRVRIEHKAAINAAVDAMKEVLPGFNGGSTLPRCLRDIWAAHPPDDQEGADEGEVVEQYHVNRAKADAICAILKVLKHKPRIVQYCLNKLEQLMEVPDDPDLMISGLSFLLPDIAESCPDRINWILNFADKLLNHPDADDVEVGLSISVCKLLCQFNDDDAVVKELFKILNACYKKDFNEVLSEDDGWKDLLAHCHNQQVLRRFFNITFQQAATKKYQLAVARLFQSALFALEQKPFTDDLINEVFELYIKLIIAQKMVGERAGLLTDLISGSSTQLLMRKVLALVDELCSNENLDIAEATECWGAIFVRHDCCEELALECLATIYRAVDKLIEPRNKPSLSKVLFHLSGYLANTVHIEEHAGSFFDLCFKMAKKSVKHDTFGANRLLIALIDKLPCGQTRYECISLLFTHIHDLSVDQTSLTCRMVVALANNAFNSHAIMEEIIQVLDRVMEKEPAKAAAALSQVATALRGSDGRFNETIDEKIDRLSEHCPVEALRFYVARMESSNHNRSYYLTKLLELSHAHPETAITGLLDYATHINNEHEVLLMVEHIISLGSKCPEHAERSLTTLIGVHQESPEIVLACSRGINNFIEWCPEAVFESFFFLLTEDTPRMLPSVAEEVFHSGLAAFEQISQTDQDSKRQVLKTLGKLADYYIKQPQRARYQEVTTLITKMTKDAPHEAMIAWSKMPNLNYHASADLLETIKSYLATAEHRGLALVVLEKIGRKTPHYRINRACFDELRHAGSTQETLLRVAHRHNELVQEATGYLALCAEQRAEGDKRAAASVSEGRSKRVRLDDAPNDRDGLRRLLQSTVNDKCFTKRIGNTLHSPQTSLQNVMKLLGLQTCSGLRDGSDSCSICAYVNSIEE